MKFIIITGPQAVGKMTVGQELVKITNLKLLHNHMTIEVLTKIFDYSRDSFRKLNEEFRMQIFKEFAKSEEEGIIFTTTWDFDDKEEWNRIYKYIQIFKDNNVDTIILGCTHYPLIRSTIREVMGQNVRLVNPAYETALQLKALLAELDISSSGTGEEEFPYRFYVSDLADEFKDFANSILPYDVSMAKKIDIEKY